MKPLGAKTYDILLKETKLTAEEADFVQASANSSSADLAASLRWSRKREKVLSRQLSFLLKENMEFRREHEARASVNSTFKKLSKCNSDSGFLHIIAEDASFEVSEEQRLDGIPLEKQGSIFEKFHISYCKNVDGTSGFFVLPKTKCATRTFCVLV